MTSLKLHDMTYSCNYPILHTLVYDPADLSPIFYDILIGETLVHSGRVIPYDTSQTSLQVDLSNIFRRYVDVFYEDIDLAERVADIKVYQMPEEGLIGPQRRFTVRSSNNENDGADATYDVVYDYNTDYDSELERPRYLNEPIYGFIDPRQFVFVSTSAVDDTEEAQHEAEVFDRNGVRVIRSFSAFNEWESVVSKIDMLQRWEEGEIEPGYTLRASFDRGGDSVYTFVAPCPGRYALYYVNKYGGLDSLLMPGRATEGWNPTRTDVRLYNDRLSRRDWEQKRIYSEQDHTFRLNTALLTDEQAKLIDHLVYSPKVWLHDLDNDIVTSVVINTSNVDVKEGRYNMPVVYTIEVKESQKQIRR